MTILRKLSNLFRKPPLPKAKIIDWRAEITKPCSALTVGGFRPTGDITASCFGEVRAASSQQSWPMLNGAALWPVCQLNLLHAPFVPEALKDISMLQVFISDDHWTTDLVTLDTNKADPTGPFFLRTYSNLDELNEITPPNHTSTFKPFESKWSEQSQIDYPTHDTMPLDFDALGVGDFYDQDGIDQVHATKIGGWPSCIQSEPWWDYHKDGHGFEYAFQIDSEDKAKCWWGDGGTIYFARHKALKNLWAVDIQCF